MPALLSRLGTGWGCGNRITLIWIAQNGRLCRRLGAAERAYYQASSQKPHLR